MSVKIIARKGTASQIESAASSVQEQGEISYATDTKEFYVSDGTQFNKIGTSDLEAFEEITIGLDLDTWHVNPDNFIDVTTDSAPMEVTFKPDGTRVFVLGSTTRTVLQYDLSTAWDLTTAGSVTQSSSLSTLSGGLFGGSLEALYIDSTGTRLYALSRGSDSISQYTIDTAWDISSLTFIRDIHVNSTQQGGFQTGEGNAKAMTFKPDGTILYIAGTTTDKIYQVPLSTAWDISSHGTITSISYTPTAGDITGIQFASSGTTLFTIDNTGESIEQWTLSTAWDITTLSLAGISLPVISMYESSPQGLYYSDTLAKAFVVGNSRDFVWEIVIEKTVKFSKAIHSDAVYGRTVNANQINVHLENDSINGIRIARNNHVQYANLNYGILTFGNGGGQIRGNSLSLYQAGTLSGGHAFKFLPNSGRRLTDSDAEQAFMQLTPDIGQSGTANYVGLLMDVTETSVGSGTNSLMDLRVGGSSKFTVRNDGKLGIGTTSPAGILHAYSTSAPVIESPSNAAMIIRRNDNTNYSSLLKYHSGNSEKFVAGLSDAGDFTDSTGEEYFIGTTKTNPLVVLKNDGKLGIGTTSPNEKLQINGNIRASGTIRVKMEQMFACSFSDDLGTTKHYLSFTSNAEQTNVHADQSAMVMPYNGRVKSIQMRLSNIDGDATRTFGIETVPAGTNMYASQNNWTIQETEAYNLTAEDDYNLVNYVFSNAGHFESGSLLAISIQDNEDAYTASRQTYVTVIIEYDLNNGMGNDTATTKYTS